MAIDIDVIKKEVIKQLTPLNPEVVILFGSFAYGTPNDNSDLDLYVVTRDNFMPQSFKEKMDIKLKVSSQLKELRKNYDIDLLVHTIPMHRKFIKLNSLFSKEITEKGEKIL